jgi:transposase
VSALVAAGYQVFPLNPVQVARYRERHGASGAKSDRGDAHVLAEIVRLDRTHHRAMAGDSPEVEGLKLVARSHQAFIWDRTRHVQRLRSALREFFPVALEAFPDLIAPEALELLERAPDPARAARLSRSKITAALARARRRDPETKAEAIQALVRAPALRQAPEIEAAYATIVSSAVRLIAQLNNQIVELQAVVAEGFGRHPDADIVTSQPGLGPILGARVPGCSPSSATIPIATPTPRRGRTTPAPRRSPVPRAPGGSCWPATPATSTWPTPPTSGPSAR